MDRARIPWAFPIFLATSCLLAQSGYLKPGNLLQNGSFEAGSDPSGFITLHAGSTDIQGWIVSRDTIDYVGSYWPASEGHRSIDLDGSPGAGAISTSIATVVGERYRVSFDLSGNSQCDAAIKRLRLKAGGQQQDFAYDTAGQPPGAKWTRQSLDFTALGSETTVEFSSLDNPDWSCGPLLDNVAVVPAAGRNTPAGVSGAWLDAYGGTQIVEQSGTSVTWKESTGGLFLGELRGRDLEVRLQPDPQLNGTPVTFDLIRGLVSLDGRTIQVNRYLNGMLTAETVLMRVATSAHDKPARLGLLLEKPSTVMALPIRAQVVIQTKEGVAVPADRDYRISLRADAATLSESRVIIPQGSPAVPFTVTGNHPGQTSIVAQSEPTLGSVSRSVYTCGSGTIRAIEFSTGETQGFADGRTPLSFSLKLTDGSGHLTTDLRSNTISLKNNGVGAVDRDSIELPGDQCISERTIESAQPGSAFVLASHGSHSSGGEFFFSLPLSVLLIALVAAGGLGGGLVRTAADYSRRRRWRARRIVIDGVAGALAGVGVFLAYYYGLLQVDPRLTGGIGLGFLLGLIGGYLGPVAIDRIAALAVPK